MRPVPRIASVALAWLMMGMSPGPRADAAGPGGEAYAPRIDPANFVAAVDHPYFPLAPGTTFRLRERHGARALDNTITVTHETKVILGVTCVVVRDRLMDRGVLVEDTYDWYAQDRTGTVWYFGEDTKEFSRDGKASTAGSWQAGAHGAQPGIIMPGEVAPGAPYRQEYRQGVAEDMGQVAAVDESVAVPYGKFTGCVRTKEWSSLEGGTEQKWYAKGIGLVRAQSAGEVAELVSVTRPKGHGR